MEKMETEKHSWEAQQEVAFCDKASLKEQVEKLEEEVRRLNYRMGALSLENIGLSKKTKEREADLVGEGAPRGVLEMDIS